MIEAFKLGQNIEHSNLRRAEARLGTFFDSQTAATFAHATCTTTLARSASGYTYNKDNETKSGT